jgi:hypothetical protein
VRAPHADRRGLGGAEGEAGVIEVRISKYEQVNCVGSAALATHIQERLIQAGVPLAKGPEFKLTRDGILQYVGPDFSSDTEIWRWYEKDEWRDPAETAQ